MPERTAPLIKWKTALAVARRDLGSQFASPTGYVFVTIFVFLSAFAAFWLPGFFERNINSLDQLNAWFPLLILILAPAIAMSAWAEERRSGTDRLLLTLPASAASIVVGKHIAAIAVYSSALAIAAMGWIGVLVYLGSPDPGLLVANLAGHWLAGGSIVCVALAASSVTRSQTIAFVVSAFGCALVTGLGWLLKLVPVELISSMAEMVDFPARLSSFGRGVIAPEDALYFIGIGAIGIGTNVFAIERRRVAGAPGARVASALFVIRFVASVIVLVAAVVTIGRFAGRLDLTTERLWSLSDETAYLIGEIPANRPVLITAFVSDDAPGLYAQTRQTLLGLLEAMRSASGGQIRLRIIPTEPYTEEARRAEQVHGVTPVMVAPDPAEGAAQARAVYLGVSVTSGPEQSVIPLLSPGLPIEYELTRAVRSVSGASKRRVGILDTEANLFGAFDFSAMRTARNWPVVDELRKQHVVERVSPDTPIPDDLDCLIVAQPSTLTDPQLPNVLEFIRNGGPTLILEDPFPQINPGIATSAPRGAGRNPFTNTPQPRSDPKADLQPLWDMLGVIVPADRIVWDGYQPHPQLAALPPEFVFVGPGSGTEGAINPDDPVTSGLQSVVLLAPGELRRNPTITLGEPPAIIPLLRASLVSGHALYDDSVSMTMFGPQWPLPNRRLYQTGEAEVLAARLFGRPADTDPGEEMIDEIVDKEAARLKRERQRMRVIIVPDLDLMSPEFFALRAMGAGDLEFDNVTFILNSVDLLVGDASLVELRKRRREHRTLTRLDEQRRARLRESRAAIDAANDAAEEQLAEAQARLDQRVELIRQREDLDDTAQRIMIESVRRDEQRRLEARSARIEDEKQARIAEARAESIRAIRTIEFRIRVAAVAIPPVPAFAVGAFVFWRRRRREREGVVQERLR